MAENEYRHDGENSQSSRDGYKSYNKEGYNKYNRSEGNSVQRHRPRFNPSAENRPQRPYRPRFNSETENGEGYRSQRAYTPRYNGGDNREQRPFRPRYNNGPQGGEDYRPQRYTPRYNYNNGEGGEQHTFRPRYNNGSQGEGGMRSLRPRFNPNQQEGYANRQQRGYSRTATDRNPRVKYSMKKQIEYKDVYTDPNEPIRLNKFLANAGICSRREADEFITAGVVSVNGQIVTELGTKIKRSDEVKFHDQPVTIERKVYVLLNKPKDCVTTSDDPQDRKTVMDLVKDACKERIYPVGRLDRNTTGVLLLTNDGDLASKLTHPKYLKKKIYHVFCDKNVTKADMDQIASGVTLDDGEIHADSISYTSDTDRSQVGIEIHSGKNRIVRRIFESLGYRVVKLDRVYFAGLTKKGLRRGDWRYLTEREVNFLRMGSFE